MPPLFSWLQSWRSGQRVGRLEAIFIASAAGEPMRACQQVMAIAGAGLEGDRYASDRGHWRRTDGCQVTLVDAADVARAAHRSALPFPQGIHRRNLVVSGIPLDLYRQRLVRIGGALFAFDRLRPPCGYLDRLAGRGAGKALGRGAGIGLKVVEGGVLRVGDPVQVLDPGRTG